MTITKIFEVDTYYSSIEDQLKPIVEKGSVLIPVFSTAKYNTIKEDGRSFGYPGDYGKFVTLKYEEFVGVIADDIFAFLELNKQKIKEAKALDFDFEDHFDLGNRVEKPDNYKVVVDKKNDWIVQVGESYIFRSICKLEEEEYFAEINFDTEEFSSSNEVVEKIIAAQKFRNSIINEANKALIDAKELISILQKSITDENN